LTRLKPNETLRHDSGLKSGLYGPIYDPIFVSSSMGCGSDPVFGHYRRLLHDARRTGKSV
jgi:hypothetical protein